MLRERAEGYKLLMPCVDYNALDRITNVPIAFISKNLFYGLLLFKIHV